MVDRQKIMWALSVVVAFFLGGMLGKEVGRSNQIMEDMAHEEAIRAYSDCILLRGQDNCVKPLNYPQ